MRLRKLLDVDLKGNVAKHVSTVVKRVTLLKTGIVQHEVGSAVNVGNMVIILAMQRGKKLDAGKTKHRPTTGRWTATLW